MLVKVFLIYWRIENSTIVALLFKNMRAIADKYCGIFTTWLKNLNFLYCNYVEFFIKRFQ